MDSSNKKIRTLPKKVFKHITTAQLTELTPNDVLLDFKSGVRIPIVENCTEKGTIYLELYRNSKKVITKRAYGQILKVKASYTIIKQGSILDRDLVFYDPHQDKIITLSKGTVFLGDL